MVWGDHEGLHPETPEAKEEGSPGGSSYGTYPEEVLRGGQALYIIW